MAEFVVDSAYIADRIIFESLCDKCPVRKWCKVKVAAASNGFPLSGAFRNYEECINFNTATENKKESALITPKKNRNV